MGFCIPASWRCDGDVDCIDGSDELPANCTSECDDPQFKCVSDSKCLPRDWVCDGMVDCSDHSDEANCTKTKCNADTEFTCNNGQCVSMSMKCDGDRDCMDGSDELADSCFESALNVSECLPSQTLCADRVTCVFKYWVCDGDSDCPDGSDESPDRCSRQACLRQDDFQCGGIGECVPASAVCNGREDCRDGSDETQDCVSANATHRPAVKCDLSKYFQCESVQNQHCVPLAKVCDGQRDCADGSDETSGCGWCAASNGNCSHQCVPLLGGRECRCPRGYQLGDDGLTCIDINECLQVGACSHKCINKEGSFKCECYPGYILEPSDVRFCKAEDNSASLLLAHRSDLRQVMLHQKRVVSLINNTKMATAFDYDYSTGSIYWVDIIDRSVYRTSISAGSSAWTPIFNNLSCIGLAVDWVYRHLYVIRSEAVGGSILVSDMDGHMLSEVVRDKVQKPHAISLDPINGWMYWTNLGSEPKIERAGMDGAHRQSIVTARLASPNGLTIDHLQDRLYWTDSKLMLIESVNTDGSDRRMLIGNRQLLHQPYSITTFEDFIYWTDWQRNAVFKANKFSGAGAVSVASQGSIHFPVEIRVYHPYRQPPGKNHCTPYNGGCSHLCLRTPLVTAVGSDASFVSDRHTVCACPNGLQLAEDGSTCKLEAAHNKTHEASSDFVKAVSDNVKSGTVVGIVFGSLIAAIVVTSVALLIFRYLDRGYGRFRFSSPVYQKTTISAFKFSRDNAPFSSHTNEELACIEPMVHRQKLNLHP